MSRALACLLLLLAFHPLEAFDRSDIDTQIDAHADKTGSLVLEHGEQSLLVRAWLADNARRSIDVQYFIWSTDNIGILASEALLRAADRGVQVRVIVDDLLMDAPDRMLMALAAHPNISIRIYNPVHSVGVPWYRRWWGMLTNFRRANQRMHNKTLIVDGTLAVTGGRNMADEYYDFDQAYNFRDRDALVLGSAVKAMQASFERFWGNPLAVPLEHALEHRDRHAGDDALIRTDWKWLHDYAADPANFAPDVRRAISAIPSSFVNLAQQVTWGEVDFISDMPGKNAGHSGLGGGGLSTTGLRKLLESAHDEVLIQSPYLVLSDAALAVFRSAIARGVRIRISTNSLASTDNLSAFSGYHRQRARLLAMGLELREYRPYPQVQKDIMDRYQAPRAQRPVFALHAKTMVIDRKVVFVGTYNLDPRSENLNTEVGVIIHDAVQASRVALAIETDMAPGNSWNPAVDGPDSAAAFYKRVKVQILQLLPLQAVL